MCWNLYILQQQKKENHHVCYINPDNHSFKSFAYFATFLEKKIAHTLFSCAHANSLLYRCYDKLPAPHERVYIPIPKGK